jgi:hypothetical protein
MSDFNSTTKNRQETQKKVFFAVDLILEWREKREGTH